MPAQPPLTAPTVSPLPATTPAATQPQLDPAVDAILGRLEQRSVSDLHARVAWQQEYVGDLPDEALIKRGELWYLTAQPVPKFLVHFTEQFVGQRKDALDEQHLFDGQWYVELQSRTKMVTRREVRRPDDRVNPYRLGEGPFPLPFGQRKQDIVREFEVALVPPAQGDPPAMDHLRLVPRPGTRTGENYKEVHFWVQQGGPLDGLPVKVRAAKLRPTGQLDSQITITFADPRLNTGLKDDRFKLETPRGYVEEVEALQTEIAPPAQP
jgi:hypothetical protein